MTYVSMFINCPICKAHYWKTDRHECPPAWRVRLDPELWGDDDEEGKLIYARDAGEAAEKFVHRHFDSYDYPNTTEVYVRRVGENTWEPYLVEMELVPQFEAKEDDERKPRPYTPEPEDVEEETDDEH